MILITVVNFIPGLIMYLEIPRESRMVLKILWPPLDHPHHYSSSSILPSMLTEKKSAVGSSASIKELRQKKYSLYIYF